MEKSLLMKAWTRLWSMISRVPIPWARQSTPVSKASTPTVTDNPPPVTKATEQFDPCYFTFKGDILEQLEGYFKYINRMRKRDREGYSLLRQVGAVLVARDGKIIANELSPWWKVHKPAFGAGFIFYSKDSDEKKLDYTPQQFCYFQKYDRVPYSVQQSNASVYRMVMYYDKENDDLFAANGTGLCLEFWVAVSDDGEIAMLKQLSHKCVLVQSRGWRGHKQWHGTVGIPQKRWSVGKDIQLLADDELRSPEHKGKPEVLARDIFVSTVNAYEQAQLGMGQIRVTRGECTAVFCIDIKRSPYFFKDRDAVVVDGIKKRIFHIVRTHKRTVRGIETFVKFHFRGLRDFVWKGYRVHITVPGWHHGYTYEELDGIGAHDESDTLPGEKHVDMEEFGKIISQSENV